jgi:hypothetical protein
MKLRLGGGALGSSSGVVIGKLLMVLHGLRNLGEACAAYMSTQDFLAEHAQ